ncbi:pyridoxal phosphate-dependent aminotransferase [Microbacterium radiodurans]|nr:pyridoxal phosphate-dependent aminotransferase [Microbacterium radiodurans]
MQLTETIESNAARRITQASRRPATLGSTPADAVALSMGEPDSGTPRVVVDAAVAALHAGRTRYTNLTGDPSLRDALAEKLTSSAGRPISSEQIVVTHGGSAGLAATMLALVDPGENVLIPEPTYSLYADHAAMVGANTIWVPNRADGGLDLEALEEQAATARMIVLCNPGNPTGRVYSTADLDQLTRILRHHPELVLLADEAYGDIVFEGTQFRSALSFVDVADQVVVCSTFSKSYAMTGWRVGYVVATPDIASRVNLLHRTVNGSINTFVQDAAAVALAITDTDLRETARSYQLRRDLVVAALDGVAGLSMLPPQGAFYAFVAIDSDLTSDEMTARFADGGVVVRSGSEFGPSGEGYVRLSFATDPDTLREGLRRFLVVAGQITHPRR